MFATEPMREKCPMIMFWGLRPALAASGSQATHNGCPAAFQRLVFVSLTALH
jgi:hypothetical protein